MSITPPTTDQLADWDRQFLWHPFTPMKPWCESKEIIIIEKGEREFLIDTLGRRYLDASSSLWCNVHGHCIPELDNAVRSQLNSVAHSTLLGLSNIPSILLAKRLIELAHASHLSLDRVFFSDNGSTAVEVACKMAFQYWRCLGETSRTRFIALDNAYHGDTLGAVSLGGIPTFHSTFKSLCFPVDFVTPPSAQSSALSTQHFLTALELLLTQHQNEYAAIILEPLVLGAGGMLMYPPEILRHIRQLADKHHTLLIFDEVLTAFGRTGKMFATQHAHTSTPIENQNSKIENPLTPDFLCLSKGLTAGYMPLGATLTSQKIFDAFYADPREGKTFFHGHTFTGHPLACAVALASLDLFEKNNLIPHVQKMSQILAEMLEKSRSFPHVFNPRHVGLIGALDIRNLDGSPFPYHLRIGGALCTRLRSLGLLLRPLADTLVIMPPLAIREENMHMLCNNILTSLTWLPEIISDIQTKNPPP